MKTIMHLSDLHIGRVVNEFSMLEDQEYFLQQVLGMIREHGVDALVIAGDIYDKSIPGEGAVNLLDDFLSELAAMRVPTFFISGNHDSDDRLRYGSRIFGKQGIHIASGYAGELPHYVLNDEEDGPIHIYLMPFLKASVVRHAHPDVQIESYEDAVRTVIGLAEVDLSEKNVIAAHQFVTDGDSDPTPDGSENASTLHVGTVERVPVSCFSDFDYVALGHIHRAQKVGRETARYAGSPLKYSLSETGYRKTVPLIRMGKKGDVTVEELPIRPLRDLRHLTGPIEKLLDPANVSDTKDYIYVTLTDDDVVLGAYDRIARVYPNLMKLDYRNRYTAESDSYEELTDVEKKSPKEIIGEFFRAMIGEEPDEEELSILYEAAEEAGVIDEAD